VLTAPGATPLIPEARLRAAHARTHDHSEFADRFGVSTRRLLLRLSEIGLTDTITSIPRRAICADDYLMSPQFEKERRIA